MIPARSCSRPTGNRTVRRLLDGLYGASGALAALFVLAIAVLVMGQVTLNIVDRVAMLVRGSALGLTIPSYSDFTGFFLAAASFLALAHTLRRGDHIRVTLLTGKLPAKAARAAEVAAVAIALLATLFLAWYVGALVLESLEYGDLSSGMVAVPLWIPQCFVALGIVVLAVALADELLGLLRGHEPSWTGRQEDLMSPASAPSSVSEPERDEGA